MKKIFLIFMIVIFILGGCSREDMKISDLEGYWVDEHIYSNNLGVDKVIEFKGNNKMIVYSYYDKGTTIYNFTVKESSGNKIIFTLDDSKEIIELERISNEKFKYIVNDEELYIVKISEDKAKEFIEVIEENSEY